jgi:REase_DpnII-MboI
VVTVPNLRTFNDERFFTLYDVAMDIKGEIDYGEQLASIPLWKSPPEYATSLTRRPTFYVELRRKAVKFLEYSGYVSDSICTDGHLDEFEAEFQMAVPDVNEFSRLAELLVAELERRNPKEVRGDRHGAMGIIEGLGEHFHAVARRLEKRHDGRETLLIEDEYDVQDLMGALLLSRFWDIRPEECTPSYAGKSSRIDFLIKQEKVVVETKMTRDGLNDGKLGEEIIIDIARYKAHPECGALFCFVYDPAHRLKNPHALESDLSGKKDGLEVRVQIRRCEQGSMSVALPIESRPSCKIAHDGMICTIHANGSP